MKRKRTQATIILGGILASTFFIACGDDSRTANKVVQKNCGSFELKITGFNEVRSFGQVLAGEDYAVTARSDVKKGFATVFEVSHDDGISFDSDNIGCTGANIGFVYLVGRYAITSDAGINWQVSDLEKNKRHCLIRSMSLNVDGNGELILSCDKIIEKVPFSTGAKKV